MTTNDSLREKWPWNAEFLRLFLVGFAIGGTLYACVGSGVFSREQSNWWGDLPQHKKIVFSTAVAATVLQTFL